MPWTDSGSNIYFTGGNVGIGTTTPAVQLHTTGAVRHANFNSGIGIFGSGGDLASGKVAVIAPGISGIAGNGTTADEAAIDTAIAYADEIEFYPGTYRIAADKTWSSGKTYKIHRGAFIKVDSGKTLTIRGLVAAGPYKIFGTSAGAFDLAGTVTGIAQVVPEWWWCYRNGSTSDSTAINAAIACVQGSASSDGTERSLTFSCGTYALASTITFTPTNAINWRVRGAGIIGGTTLIALSAFTGSSAIVFAASAGTTGITDFEVGGFVLLNQTGGAAADATCGIFIGGGSGTQLTAAHQNKFEDIRVGGFDLNIYQVNADRILYFRCSATCKDGSVTQVSGSICVQLDCNGGVTGATDFVNCEFEGVTTNTVINGKCVSVNDLGHSNANFGGIRFTNCTFYGAATQLELYVSGTGSHLTDVWIDPGCQFEGPAPGTSTMILIGAQAASSFVTNVNINGVYGSGNGFNKHIVNFVANSGTVNDIFITGCRLSNADNEFIDFRGTNGTCKSLTISGNQLKTPDSSGNSAVYIENCSQVTVNGNALTGSTATKKTNMIQFNSGGDYLTAQGNNSGGLATGLVVQNTTGAAHPNIVNNV